MKNFKLKRLLSLAFIGCLSTLNATPVFAFAGDPIANTATLEFTVGVGTTTVNSNTVTFNEDRVINFTVAEAAPIGTMNVAANTTGQIQTFTVTNNGNDHQDFLLTAVNPAGVGDQFDIATTSVFVDSNATGTPAGDVYLAGTDTGIFIDELAPGDTRTVYIVSTIPTPLNDGDVAVMTLIAQVAAGNDGVAAANETAIANAGAEVMSDSNGHVSPAGTFGTGAELRTTVAVGGGTVVDGLLTLETVFNDPAGLTGSDVSTVAGFATQDVLYNGQHSANDSYTVAAAVLSVAKTQLLIWDPVNGVVANDPKAITGAYVRYTLTITNAEAASASGFLTTMTDTLTTEVAGVSGGLALDPDLLDGTGIPAGTAGVATTNPTESFGVAHGAVGAVTNTRTATSPVVCTGFVADADGCNIAGQDMTFTFADLLPADAGGGAPYLAGEIKPGETVTITYNAIIQ